MSIHSLINLSCLEKMQTFISNWWAIVYFRCSEVAKKTEVTAAEKPTQAGSLHSLIK